MPIITNVCRLLRKSTAMGLVLVLVLVGLSPAAEAGLWVKRDWSRVQALTSGTRVKVELYKDQAPKGKRTNQGLFRSATAQSITLLLPDGRSRTMERTSVRKVLARRPFKKRWPGWAALVVSATTLELFCAVVVGDCNLGVLRRLQAHGLITGPIVGAIFGGSRKVGIYNVPPNRRIP